MRKKKERKKEYRTNPFDWIVKQRLVKLILSCYGLGVLAPTLQLWILKEHSSQLSTLHTKRTHPVFGSGLGKDLFLRKALGGVELAGSAVIHMDLWLAKQSRYVSVPPKIPLAATPPPPLPPDHHHQPPFHFPPQPQLANRGQTEPSSNLIQPAPLLLKGPLSIFLCLGIKPASRIQPHGPFNGAAGQKCNHILLRM